MKLAARTPLATYRLQMHAGFNFDQLAQIVPYLHDLGVSDVYLSPFFRAAPGSTHGYDVCDHNEINEELGGMEGLKKVSGLLRERNMGLLIDFVPNHMGIEGASNWRWMDVLENGHHSRFASFFDIQWNPRQSALQDRILVPLLHNFYGRVLDAGEIQIRYAEKAFWVFYGSLRFPLRPESYGTILQRLAWYKDPGSENAKKLEKLAEEFRDLPKPLATENPEEATKREQERTRLRQELAAFIQAENLAANLEQVLKTLNGNPKNPDSFDALHEILEEQNYRLAYWKTGTHEINYRRFFAIDTLVGLHMEDPEVFAASHRLLQILIKEGMVNGVRIDHVDGLWDPAQYLDRLSQLDGGTENPFYSLVEKILTENEALPENWATHGTTGYDFIGSLINLLVDSRSENEFTRIYGEFTGLTLKPDEQAYRLKLYIMEELFPNAIDSLALELVDTIKADRRWRDWTMSDLRPALARIIACLSVYRTYRTAGQKPCDVDIRVVESAVTEALRLSHSSNPAPFLFIQDIWTGRYPDEKAGPELKTWADAWISKLQQYTGAIMAKSVEDTLFYRYVRLFGANEVGHHPAEFGRPPIDFHKTNLSRATHWPASLLATSTHDTKMSEDVRTRLLALSEMPDVWESALQRWSRMNHPSKTLVNDQPAPDANEEYLLYQILLGAWPLQSEGVDETFCGRIKDYMRKALSESKAHTNWASPDELWLKACEKFIDNLLNRKTSGAFLDDFQSLADRVAFQGMNHSLVQVALKLTSPGVPDFYQGTEIWDFSLVDPDNRRPVDYETRRKSLLRLDHASMPELFDAWKDGRIKMHLIRTLLRYRRDHPDLFLMGTYTPVKITGPHAEKFIAYRREEKDQRILVVALIRAREGNTAGLGEVCAETSLSVPKSSLVWQNLLTGQELKFDSSEIPLEKLFDLLPIAIFVSDAK